MNIKKIVVFLFIVFDSFTYLFAHQIRKFENINESGFKEFYLSQDLQHKADEYLEILKIGNTDQIAQFENSLKIMDLNFLKTYVFKKGYSLLTGTRIPDRTTKAPLLSADKAELLANLKWPGGNVAIAKGIGENVRIFLNGFFYGGSNNRDIQIGELTLNRPFSIGSSKNSSRSLRRPLYNEELSVFPDEKLQEFLNSAFAVYVDKNNRLWVLDHGGFGIRHPKLAVYSLSENEPSKLLFLHVFNRNELSFGSMLNDIAVDENEGLVYLTDTGALNRNPGLLVVKFIPEAINLIENNKSESSPVTAEIVLRLLNKHPSVSSHKKYTHYYNKYLPSGEIKEVAWTIGPRFRNIGLNFGKARIGVNGIALDKKNQILYYAPTNRGQLFRINTYHIKNLVNLKIEEMHASEFNGDKKNNDFINYSIQQLGEKVEKFADITATDGIAIDESTGEIYLTDQEHDAIVKVSKNGELTTVLKDPMFRWPASIRVGPDGLIYFSCFDIPAISGRIDGNHIYKNGPFPIYRFNPH